MGLKQILSDAKAKVESEMNTAINTAVALATSSDIQPKLNELEASKSAAIKERTDAINYQISSLRTQLAQETAALNSQCDEAKIKYKTEKIAEVTEKVKSAYQVQLSKLDAQIEELTDESF